MTPPKTISWLFFEIAGFPNSFFFNFWSMLGPSWAIFPKIVQGPMLHSIVEDFPKNERKIKKRKIPFLRRSVGMIFQDYHLLRDRNLYENIALPLHVMGFTSNQIASRVDEAIELVGLEGKESHLPRELSGGEQQRASLARAFIKEPDIILADEPTGNLDPVASFELVRLLETINETGTTVLMASHNYNLIKGRGRPIFELKNGILRVR